MSKKIFSVLFLIFIPTIFFIKKSFLYYVIAKDSEKITASLKKFSDFKGAGPKPSLWKYEFQYNNQVYTGVISGINFFKQPLFTLSFLETGAINPGREDITVFFSKKYDLHLPFMPTIKHWIILSLNYLLIVAVIFIFVKLVL